MPLSTIRFYVANRAWLADLTRAIDLATPISFNRQKESWFGAPAPSSQPLVVGSFVGSVARGGSVNASVLTLTPHGVGTHTESVGHVTLEPQSVESVLSPGLFPATLATSSRITSKDAKEIVGDAEPGFLEALVVRRSAHFEAEALRYLVREGVHHLIVESPSIDPEDDQGRLEAHRAFWGMAPNSTEGVSPRTITELARVPAEIRDGPYLLDLQIPRLVTDAAPSRPVLFPVRRVE